MIKGLLGLVGGTLAFWALVSLAARLLWPGGPTLLWSTAAALLCLVPAALTLAWARWAYEDKPEGQLLAVFGGTALRMAVVMAAGLALFYGVEGFGHQRFWLFVVVYYLFTLALELLLVVRGAAPGPARPKNQGGVAR